MPHIPQNQKKALLILALLALALPVLILVVYLKTNLLGRAATSTIPPIITTSELPRSFVNQNYRFRIEGRDLGYGNILRMTISGFPETFKLDSNQPNCTLVNNTGRRVLGASIAAAAPTTSPYPTPTPTPIKETITPTSTPTPTPTTSGGPISLTPTPPPTYTSATPTPTYGILPIPAPRPALAALNCTLTGSFTKPGTYAVSAKLTNIQSTLSSEKTFRILVSPKPTPLPINR